MRTTNLPVVLSVVCLGACVGTILAQQPTGAAVATVSKQEQIAALKSALAADQAALKQYTWTETTRISLKGEVKKQTQKTCSYGPDGKVQKVAVAGASQPQQQPPPQAERGRGGRLKKEIAKNKVEDIQEYMERVAEFVHSYAPPDPQKIQAAQAAGNITVTPSQPVASITIKNYAKEGDSVVIGFDAVANKIATYAVNSYLDKPKDDAVKLTVNFARLPDGTNYVQQTVLNAPGKKVDVNVMNSDYRKPAQ